MKNKKANVLDSNLIYIVAFFIQLFIFVVVVASYDFFLEEVNTPVHSALNESLIASGINKSSPEYIEFERNFREDVKQRNINFNLMLIFISVYAVIVSLISAAKSKRMPIETLIFRTVGGVLMLMFVLQYLVFDFINYLHDNFINIIFVDVIINYLPFYVTLTTGNTPYLIAAVWAFVLIITNRLLGDEN